MSRPTPAQKNAFLGEVAQMLLSADDLQGDEYLDHVGRTLGDLTLAAFNFYANNYGISWSVAELAMARVYAEALHIESPWVVVEAEHELFEEGGAARRLIELLDDESTKRWLKSRAIRELQDPTTCAPEVREHLQRLAAMQSQEFDDTASNTDHEYPAPTTCRGWAELWAGSCPPNRSHEVEQTRTLLKKQIVFLMSLDHATDFTPNGIDEADQRRWKAVKTAAALATWCSYAVGSLVEHQHCSQLMSLLRRHLQELPPTFIPRGSA